MQAICITIPKIPLWILLSKDIAEWRAIQTENIQPLQLTFKGLCISWATKQLALFLIRKRFYPRKIDNIFFNCFLLTCSSSRTFWRRLAVSLAKNKRCTVHLPFMHFYANVTESNHIHKLLLLLAETSFHSQYFLSPFSPSNTDSLSIKLEAALSRKVWPVTTQTLWSHQATGQDETAAGTP